MKFRTKAIFGFIYAAGLTAHVLVFRSYNKEKRDQNREDLTLNGSDITMMSTPWPLLDLLLLAMAVDQWIKDLRRVVQ